jgi:hypothetical protein
LLTATTSHLIQETVGDEHVIALVGSTAPREAKLRRRYWPRRWDVYLHPYEYMELAYKQRWYWKDTRKTIKQTDSGVLGWHLVSVLFYQPQLHLDVSYEAVTNELDNPDGIEIQSVVAVMPGSTAPAIDSLEKLAKLAFPQSKEEKFKTKARKAKAVKEKEAILLKRAMEQFGRETKDLSGLLMQMKRQRGLSPILRKQMKRRKKMSSRPLHVFINRTRKIPTPKGKSVGRTVGRGPVRSSSKKKRRNTPKRKRGPRP